MQAEHLDLTVGAFGNRKDGFIHRASGDREFLLDTTEQYESHKSKSQTSDKNDYVNS
jgi:hypothetical protein